MVHRRTSTSSKIGVMLVLTESKSSFLEKRASRPKKYLGLLTVSNSNGISDTIMKPKGKWAQALSSCFIANCNAILMPWLELLPIPEDNMN
jgi:hypothetical protein